MQAANILIDTTNTLQQTRNAPQRQDPVDHSRAGASFLDHLRSEVAKTDVSEEKNDRSVSTDSRQQRSTSVNTKDSQESTVTSQRNMEKTEQSGYSEKTENIPHGRNNEKTEKDVRTKGHKTENLPAGGSSASGTESASRSLVLPAEHTEQRIEKTDGKKNHILLKQHAKEAPVQKKDTAEVSAENIVWLAGTVTPQSEKRTVPEDGKKNKHASPGDAKNSVQAILDSAQELSVKDPAQFLRQLGTDGQNKSEKEKTDTKQDKIKKTEKVDPKAVFTVTDLRTEASVEPQIKTNTPRKSDLAADIKYNGQNGVQMTLNLSDRISQNILSSSGQAAGATGSNFQAMLANQIRNSAADFVRAGSIVLRDNNVGHISLVLHPESLGNVKINLQLTDKVIAGHITVASREAYDAFRESIDSLRQAFTQNGFDGAAFDLSWSGQGTSGYGNGGNGNRDAAELQHRSVEVYGDYASAGTAISGTETMSPSTGGYSVNIVA